MGTILVINPGSTTTKLALSENQEVKAEHTIIHLPTDLQRFATVSDQTEFRLADVWQFLSDTKTAARTLKAIIGRGGLLKPIPSGVYRVTAGMLAELKAARYGEHASNLGALLAHRVAQEVGCPAYIADPVVVDELAEPCRLTGMPELNRKSIFHALNQKSAAREVARQLGRNYDQCNFIVAHLGGGISVGAHRQGRVMDVNNALDGEGPLAPERAGTLPAGQLVELCFSGAFTLAEMKHKIIGHGGLVAHFGSNRYEDLEQAAAAGDERAKALQEAMVLRISQEIAKHGATLSGRVDRIIITGGLARSAALTERIRQRVAYLAPVEVIPGEREMLSLSQAAWAVLHKEIEESVYS